MSLRDLIYSGFKQIRTRFLESALIILGIGLGIAVICSVIGLIEGFNKQTREQFNQPQGRIFEIAFREIQTNEDFYAPLQRIKSPEEKGGKLTYHDYQTIKAADILGKQYTWLAVQMGESRPNEGGVQLVGEASYEEHQKWERANMFQLCIGTPEVFEIAGYTLVKGDFFRESDIVQKKKVIVIGDELSKSCFPDSDPIGQTISLRSGTFTVIGVVHSEMATSAEKFQYLHGIGSVDNLNWLIFVPFFSYPLFGREGQEDEVMQIYVMVDKNIELAGAYGCLKEYLANNFPKGVNLFGSYTFQQEAKKALGAFGMALGIFSCAALLIAAINILNLMLARVLRRYKHIGISSAVGASKRDIFNLFLTEAVILGLIGSIFGIILAVGGLKLLNTIIHQQLRLTLFTVSIGVSVSVVTSLIFGLYPASQAAQVQPVEALKME